MTQDINKYLFEINLNENKEDDDKKKRDRIQKIKDSFEKAKKEITKQTNKKLNKLKSKAIEKANELKTPEGLRDFNEKIDKAIEKIIEEHEKRLKMVVALKNKQIESELMRKNFKRTAIGASLAIGAGVASYKAYSKNKQRKSLRKTMK